MFDIKKEVEALYPEIKALRRQIHMNPEIAYQEFKTSALVEQVLNEAGIEIVKYPDSTAVVGILRGGKPGKTIALRADMDALPLQEEVEWEGKSTVAGIMHACGHDMHTAGLMGVAKILSKHKEEIPGTVKFLFQPAEESPPGGAKGMVAAGALKNPDVDMVFGLHVGTDSTPGHVKVNYGYSSANSDRCNITIFGKGGHGAYPQTTVDSVVVASHVVVALQTIVSRNIAPLDNAVISVGSFHAGTVNNIIADSAKLQITVRSLDPEVRETLKARIQAVTEGICTAMGANCEVNYMYGYSSTLNTDSASDIVKAAALNVVGEDHMTINTTPSMGGEDFSYFAMEVPGGFFGIGAKPDREVIYPGHNPNFFVDEEALKTGMEMMVSIVFEANK